MKICFLNATQGLADRGAETYVKELVKRLSKNYDVEIFSSKKVPPKRWPFLWRLFLDPYGVYILKFTLKHVVQIYQNRYDVVIPLNGGWEALVVRIVTKLYGGKVVISGQSGRGWDERVNLWTFPDCFIALSTQAKLWAKKVNPFVKIEYVPNGVDLAEFRPFGKTLHVYLKKPIVLCVGALTPTKRIDLTIQAVARLEGVSLLIAGDGILKEKIKTMGEELLGDRFCLTSLHHDKMPDLYRVADVFTIPSQPYYSFEIVITEAMSTNLPVVVNDDSIRREIVGSAGIFVNPENIERYANALNEALNINWGNKPRLQAEKFSWDNIARKYQELFEEINR